VEPGHFLVEVLWAACRSDGVVDRPGEQLDLGDRLVGEGVRHHEAGMAGGVAQVQQAALGQQDHGVAVGEAPLVGRPGRPCRSRCRNGRCCRPEHRSRNRPKAGPTHSGSRRAKTHAISVARPSEQPGVNLTQVELAQRLGTVQANVSKTEQRHDMLLSTLANYFSAMGADDVKIVVRRGEREIEVAFDALSPKV